MTRNMWQASHIKVKTIFICFILSVKGTLPQSIFFLKSGHHGAIGLWNNSYSPKYLLKEMITFNLWIIFAVNLHWKLCLCLAKSWSNADFAPQNYGAMMTLPRKILEPSYFAPQNHGAFILCPAKWQSLHTLLRKVMEQCRLGPAKSWRQSFRGQNKNL